MTKAKLRKQVKRYITLLSALKQPPVQLIEDLDFFVGMVDTANKDELAEAIIQWEKIKPQDANSLKYIGA